jgi:hypothetical protein
MTSRLTRVFIAVLAASAFAGTAVASAHTSPFKKEVRAALRDCASTNTGTMKGHYSLKVLETALTEIKAEPLQYTGCADVLLAAIHKESLGHIKPKPSITPHRTPVTRPSSRPVIHHNQNQVKKRVHHLQSEGGKPLTLPTGQTVTPGVVTTRSASFLSNLPTPLLIVLAALLAAVVAVGGWALQNFVRARRSR